MDNSRIGRILVSRKFFYIIVLALIGIYIARDYTRMNRECDNLIFFLDNVRLVSGRDHKPMMATFSGKSVSVRKNADSPVITVFQVPTLDEMNYASDLGNHVVLFENGAIDGRRHNKSDGFIRLKSLVGFKKTIRITSGGITRGD